MLFRSQEQQLENDLRLFAKTTSTQIVVVSVNSLSGYDKASFTYEIGEQWGVGSKEFDNGIVLMLKPKEVDGKGKTYIAIGYGLEGVIPDATAKRIIEAEMIPWFKQQDYYQGVLAAIVRLKELASEEYSAEDYMDKTNNAEEDPIAGAVGFIIILFIIFLFKARSVRRYSLANDLSFWAAWMLLSQSSRSHGGSFSDFSSGGGSFGGFGGGSFGGGGAGGDW